MQLVGGYIGQHYLDGHCFRTGDTGVWPFRLLMGMSSSLFERSNEVRGKYLGIPMKGRRYPKLALTCKEQGQHDKIPGRRSLLIWNSSLGFEWRYRIPTRIANVACLV